MKFRLQITVLLCCICPAMFAQTHTQTLRGTVIDKESQMPLIGANILIEGTVPLLGSSTDADGRFSILDVPIGRQTVAVSYLGYEPITIPNLVLITGKEMVLDIELTESTVKLAEAVIRADDGTGQALNEMAFVSARSFSVEETQRYAGSFYDPARMALNFAGVSITGGSDDLFNEIVVRGNSPRGVLWRLEGIEIPNPNHFGAAGNSGGGVSMLSSSTLASSDFYTGAFPAEFGNALSGAFDLNLRKGNTEKKEYAFMIGALGVEAAIEGPMGKRGGSYLFNVRYATLGILQALGVNPAGDVLPTYGDISFNINMPTKNIGTFSLFGLGGANNSYFHPESDSTQWDDPVEDREGFDNKQRVGTIGLTHKLLLSNKSYLRTVVAGSIDRLTEDGYYLDQRNNYTRVFDYKDVFENNTYRATSTYTQKISARNTIKLGGIISRQEFNFQATEFNTDLDRIETFLNNKGSAMQYQAFGQWKHRVTDKFSFTAGVHYLHYALNGHSSIEPRLGARLKLNERSSLNAAFGLHSKPEHPSFYFIETTDPGELRRQPNRDMDFIKSLHTVLGYSHQFNKHFRMRAEAYYQYLYDVAVDSDENQPVSILNAVDIWDIINIGPMVTRGKGKNLGIDLTLEKSFSQNYYFLITSSIFDSDYRALNGKWFDTRYSSKYQINLVGGKEWRKGKTKDNIFGINTRLILNGGNRTTPINLAKSMEYKGTVRDFNNINGESVGTYVRLDLGLSYKINREGLTHSFSIDVQNVSNRLNRLADYYNVSQQSVQYQEHSGLLPIFNYRIEF